MADISTKSFQGDLFSGLGSSYAISETTYERYKMAYLALNRYMIFQRGYFGLWGDIPMF